jgi:succinoglycan biosynthesis protein ExoM
MVLRPISKLKYGGTMAIQISICVCTYRRPGVADTVHSLFAQAGLSHSDHEIIVADDDPDLSARGPILKLAEHAPVEVRYVVSGARNISSCRNICLEAARGTWVAFIDDDQVAEPNWLQEMMSTATEFGADAVKSYVRAIYPPETPDWIRAGRAYTYDYGQNGKELLLVATCGILFRRDFLGARELLFDVNLGTTGGEDIEYFMRYRKLGGKIVSCQTAVANEIVAPERVNPSHLRRRLRGFGRVTGCVLLAKETLLGRSMSILKSIVGVTVTCPYAAVRVFDKAAAGRLFIRFWYFFGVLEWAVGRSSIAHE